MTAAGPIRLPLLTQFRRQQLELFAVAGLDFLQVGLQLFHLFVPLAQHFQQHIVSLGGGVKLRLDLREIVELIVPAWLTIRQGGPSDTDTDA